MSRRYWEDAETGRRGITDGDLPDGPLVEEISAAEFYDRQKQDLCEEMFGSLVCVCGKAEMDGKRCRYGASHISLAPTTQAAPELSADDEEALS